MRGSKYFLASAVSEKVPYLLIEGTELPMKKAKYSLREKS
jgi:hypothetical protein